MLIVFSKMPGGWVVTTTNHLENSRYCAKFPSTLFSKKNGTLCFPGSHFFFGCFLIGSCGFPVEIRFRHVLKNSQLLSFWRAFESDIGKKILMKYGWTEGWQRANGFRRCFGKRFVFFRHGEKKKHIISKHHGFSLAF